MKSSTLRLLTCLVGIGLFALSPPRLAEGSAASGSDEAAPSYDLLIVGGHVVDGTGNPWYSSDVGIRNGRIADIGKLAGSPAQRTIDARGLVVTPGFIDMLGQSEITLLVDGRAESEIRQGITTEFTGEGGSAAPQSEKTLPEFLTGCATLS